MTKPASPIIPLASATLAVVALMAGLAPWLGRLGARLDLIAHVTPFLIAPPLLGLLCNRQAGWRRTVSILGFLGVVAALVMGLTWPSRETSGAPLKLVSMNVWTHNRNARATAAWIRSQRADFVMLQEAGEKGAAVAALLRPDYPFTTRAPDFEPCGSVILSRTPVIAQGFTPSPDPEGSHCAVWARYRFAGRLITLVDVHMLWPTFGPWRQAQDHLIEVVTRAAPRGTLIVAGDFNATPWSQALKGQDLIRGLTRRDQVVFTWPMQPWTRHRFYSPVPFLALDHVFAGSDWLGGDVRASPRLGSTHRGLVTQLYLKPDASK